MWYMFKFHRSDFLSTDIVPVAWTGKDGTKGHDFSSTPLENCGSSVFSNLSLHKKVRLYIVPMPQSGTCVNSIDFRGCQQLICYIGHGGGWDWKFRRWITCVGDGSSVIPFFYADSKRGGRQACLGTDRPVPDKACLLPFFGKGGTIGPIQTRRKRLKAFRQGETL